MYRLFSIPLIFVCAMTGILSGCTTFQFVKMREKPPNPILERLTTTTFQGPRPSKRSERFLTESGYAGGDNFVHMLTHTRKQLGTERQKEALHAMAEISYLAARCSEKSDRGLAMELCLDASQFGWTYLTLPSDDGHLTSPNTRQNRATTDIYNTSLQQLLRMVRASGDYHLGQPIRMPVTARVLNIEVPFPSRWLTKSQLGEFAFVSDYDLKNLSNRHTTPGIGVPIMVRRKSEPSQPLENYYSKRLALPVTVVAKFPPSSPTLVSEEPILLQLLDPRESDGLLVNNSLLPLESDISTPLAWSLTDSKNSLLETFAFLRPDKARKLEGLQMVQPFDPDRIPVLMVHGIWSSPLTWMEMFNDLQADPVLREKYQFWFYMYPTGEPLTFAAANLRERLRQLRLQCDRNGQNEKLDQMVVVGHSMGGLLAYLMTVDSDDKLWNGLSRLPVNQIQADQETHSQIQRVFFFESDRSIDRIVTIASPFKGSGYANRFTRWLSGALISLPTQTSQLSQLIFRQNNQSVWDRMFAPRTSLDSLGKGSAVLKLVGETTVPADVRHHNVVGVSKGNSPSEWTDGVVKLKSAHREDVASEVQVKSPHSEIQRHPETIKEVRRVLLEHLKEIKSNQRDIIQVQRKATSGSTDRVSLLTP